MPTTPQHGLLTRLLDYVVEQGKEIDPRAYVLTGDSDFRLFPKDLAGLPGVELDRKVEGDHIWLQVARLESASPPAPDDQSRPYITFSDDPNGPQPAINDTALKHRLVTDRRSMSEEAAASWRERVVRALAEYTPLWQAWAEGENPRRRTIALYGDLFMLKGRLEAEETSTPSELVWGMGVSSWKFSGTLTDNGNGKAVSIDYQYPLLTQVVEIDLDAQTHTISVRPRAVAPRLEFDAFGVCQVMGTAEVEKQAKALLDSDAARPLTPFDTGSFEPILKLAAGNLDRAGRYDPDSQGLPTPSEQLLVTAGWVLLVRPRSANFLVEDIRRLKGRLQSGDVIPAGPACFVTPPSDDVVKYEAISFRGLCSGSRSKGEPRELYFPLPYNQEQETYRIDMVVEGANDVRLAVECDGDEFHGPDRWLADMHRQRTLERAGWVFWRCFASTWSLRKDDVLMELRARLHVMGIEPLGALERMPLVVESRNWPPVSTPAQEPGGAEAAGEAEDTASA